jgi:uroporphyrinogen decarboxylase
MSMTSYERYLAVCELREPDRVPISPLIMTFAARLAGVSYRDYCRDGEVMAQAQLECIRRFGYDSVNVTSDTVRESEAVGAPVFWQEDEVPGAGGEPFIKDRRDLKRLRLPDPLGDNRMHEQIRALEILRQELGDNEVVYGWVEAPIPALRDECC